MKTIANKIDWSLVNRADLRIDLVRENQEERQYLVSNGVVCYSISFDAVETAPKVGDIFTRYLYKYMTNREQHVRLDLNNRTVYQKTDEQIIAQEELFDALEQKIWERDAPKRAKAIKKVPKDLIKMVENMSSTKMLTVVAANEFINKVPLAKWISKLAINLGLEDKNWVEKMLRKLSPTYGLGVAYPYDLLTTVNQVVKYRKTH